MTNRLSEMVRRGATRSPIRVMLYGVEGIGKTTWAAKAPDAVFIGTEDGYGDLDVAHLPAVKRWRDVVEQVEALINEPHDFRTVVIDTIDHLERVVWQHVCDEARVETIEAVGGGYGKGYTQALEEQERLAKRLDHLRNQRGMHVILLGHSAMETVSSPDSADYTKYGLKMNKKAGAFWREWVDVLLFAQRDVRVKTTERGERALLARGKATGGDRVVMTQGTPAYDAKSRYTLPEQLPLDFGAFARAVKLDSRGQPKPFSDEDRAKAMAKLAEVGVEAAEVAARFGDTPSREELVTMYREAQAAQGGGQ